MAMDKSRYPANWREISQRIRFERAKGCCEWCQAEHGKPHPETGGKVCLTVAHLNHDTTDNRDENLAALCNACHLRYDAKLHAEHAKVTRLMKKHQAIQAAGQKALFER